jgi:ribosomal protein S18 acetylase RimI-like enzyme
VGKIELLDGRRHDRSAFSCGEPLLDRYLREQASQHHRDGIATTHVLVDDDQPSRIIGYYSLAAAQVLLTDLSDADRRGMPRYPVPAVRMARLAVASTEAKQGHGSRLLAHAVKRCLDLRLELGVRVLVVDALNESAVAFYESFGFRHTTSESRSLYLSLGRP